MNRRKFVKYGSAAVTASSMFPNLAFRSINDQSMSFNQLQKKLIEKNDSSMPTRLESQLLDKNHRWFGGIKDRWRIPTAGGSAGFIQSLTCAYVSEESKYYKSVVLLNAMMDASAYLLNVQYEDGTIDLLSTNFHSTPDTGFVVEPLALSYTVLVNQNDKGLKPLVARLKEFLVNAGNALSVGGIHTPNHRWVVCMALARINALFPKNKYVDRIDTWLNEKIDIDPDGQFTEKSASIYSPLTDQCLITIARLTEHKELLDAVRKNLDMTLYYIHDNGEIVTEASIRQDQYRVAFPDRYYYSYRYMAIHDKNGLYSAMASKIEETSVDRLTRNLIYFMEDPDLKGALPTESKLPDNYEKPFIYSNLVRIRRKKTDATILAKNSTFFTFFNGNAALQSMRLASAFFGRGQFIGSSVDQIDGKYVLKWDLTKGYYQPFPEDRLPEDGDWNKMLRNIRDLSEVQVLEAVIKIGEGRGIFTIEFDIWGTDNVPVAIELGFRKGGILEGVREYPDISSAYILEKGMGKYTLSGDHIEFGPGINEHDWMQLRGALPKLDAECVYLTGFTPFRHEISVKG